MLVSNTPFAVASFPIVPYKKNCQPAFVDNSLKKDTVSFSGRTGNFLDKKATSLMHGFKQELFVLLMSEKPVAENFKWLTSCIFKDFKFELKDIKEVKYPDIIANPPTVFAKNTFGQSSPHTNLFLNFDRITKIRNNAADPRVHFAKYTEEIAQCVASSNEYHFISNVVDEFTQELTQIKNINKESVSKIIQKLNDKHKLDLNFKITDSEAVPGLPASHSAKLQISSSGEIHSELFIDFAKSEDELRTVLPHEFTHLLGINSIELQNYKSNFSSKEVGHLVRKHQQGLADILENNYNFLSLPTKVRKEKYDELLRAIIKDNKGKNSQEVISFIEKMSRDETLAYCKTPKDTPFAQEEATLLHVFKDFYNYILAVKYDASKFPST